MENLVLIDGNSLINRAFYAMPVLTTKDGTYTNAVYGFMNMLFKILSDIKPKYLAVAFDLKAPTFRHKMFKDYKGTRKPMPEEWTVGYRDLTFKVKPMGFKHTGLFPEQAVNWDRMRELISAAGRPIRVLNLFAYTGGATVACAKAGAEVTHVDAAKGMVERAGENVRLSEVDGKVRYIVDDCKKFVQREIRRGNRYDAIIMDPPSYGRGPGGEIWKIESELYDFVSLCAGVLSDHPLFFLINSYTAGLQPMVLSNILTLLFGGRGKVEAYEVGIQTEEGIPLPCGAGGMFIYE